MRSVLLEPAHPYTKALLGADPHAHEHDGPSRRLVSIPGQVPQPRDWPTSCRFAKRCTFATSACTSGSIPLTTRPTGPGLTRCIRAEELFSRTATAPPAATILSAAVPAVTTAEQVDA